MNELKTVFRNREGDVIPFANLAELGDKKVVAIVQARMGSSRFPGKSLSKIGKHPIIKYLYDQLQYSTTLTHFVLATTRQEKDDDLALVAENIGWQVFRGDENDVLSRYYDAAITVGCSENDFIVRVTGDDIFPDPEMLDNMVKMLAKHHHPIHHVSNNRKLSFPYGSDIEVFTMWALSEAQQSANTLHQREHVTPYIRSNSDLFPFLSLEQDQDYSHISLSIDHPKDLARAQELMAILQQSCTKPFHVHDIINSYNKLGQ